MYDERRRRPEAPDPDSEDTREDAAIRFERFLKKVKFESSSAEARVEWLKKQDFESFMDMLSVMNGILRGAPRFTRWEGRSTKAIVKMASGSSEDADLEPPENAHEEFKKVFEEVKVSVDTETLRTGAARLYTGIIFGHMFPDGNGRTARNTYALMTTGVLPKHRLTKKRGIEAGKLAFELSAWARYDLLKGEGLDVARWQEGYYMTRGGVAPGDMSQVEYVAARRVLSEAGKETGEKIEWDDLTEDERLAFEKEYADVRREYFWHAQNVVQTEPRILETFDAMVKTDREENRDIET